MCRPCDTTQSRAATQRPPTPRLRTLCVVHSNRSCSGCSLRLLVSGVRSLSCGAVDGLRGACQMLWAASHPRTAIRCPPTAIPSRHPPSVIRFGALGSRSAFRQSIDQPPSVPHQQPSVGIRDALEGEGGGGGAGVGGGGAASHSVSHLRHRLSGWSLPAFLAVV